jgi:hypothetical protein
MPSQKSRPEKRQHPVAVRETKWEAWEALKKGMQFQWEQEHGEPEPLSGLGQPVPFDALRLSWWAQDLGRFIEENNPDAIKMYLRYLVDEVCGCAIEKLNKTRGFRDFPEGVFQQPKREKPGRRTSSGRYYAYYVWEKVCGIFPIPPNRLPALARAVYGREYSKAANTDERRAKQLRDNCVRNIKRELLHRQNMRDIFTGKPIDSLD